MTPGALAFAAYWRTALADAALGSGGLKKSDLDAFVLRPLSELASGVVDGACVERLFAGAAAHVQEVQVVLRPRVCIQKLMHGQAQRNSKPPCVLPLLSLALLTRSGQLYPTGYTVVPRDILDPLDKPAYAIGSVDAQDAFLTRCPAPCITPDADADAGHNDDRAGQWQRYLDYCGTLIAHVAPQWQPHADGYVQADCWYLYKADAAKGASTHILGLYDQLAVSQPVAPLFDRYACTTAAAPLPCLPHNAGFAGRLGHASDRYPLADAQRDSLAHLLASPAGAITCVNGPPGTGKTTLLLSVVATLWAQAALEGGAAPVMLAASTNNQAVTNIIDAFGRDFAAGAGPLAGRWLPDVQSFGAYFPSIKKEAALAGQYQTRAFFERVENAAFVGKAQAVYLAQAALAFPELQAPTIGTVVARLQDGIRTAFHDLARLEALWRAVEDARAAVLAGLGADPPRALAALHERLRALDARLRAVRAVRARWEDYLTAESIWLALFAWLPPVARKRERLARRFWASLWPADVPAPQWARPDEAEALVEARVGALAVELEKQQQMIAQCEALLAAQRQATDAWAAECAHQGLDGAMAADLAAVDRMLDTTLRFDVFRLATHYWEGRWLLDMLALLPELEKEKKKTGRVAVEARWRRRMQLTPCAVSTFFMLPSLFKVQRHDGGQFVPDYLYDFIDLLIVDEAGQVLPEVAAASFALARRALVIGDTMQIAPIWSVPRHVDVGNLIAHALIDPAHADAGLRRIADMGKTASSGSVMRIAQHASPYQSDPDLSPGLYLYEHRRCYDEIIAYCNALCYKGKLLPMRGARPAADATADAAADADAVDALPALGYVHVDGICQRDPGGSAYNLLEAGTIAAWLAENRETLEARYGRPLAQIVGVVTPFSAQVAAIDKACRALQLTGADKEENITIGTVHALQGAERAVVIFSPCYSKHLDGRFIDQDPSMLNVAVSRAKDSFLVFGDMDVLETSAPATPRGLLAACLFRDPANALQVATGERTDLLAGSTALAQLRDAAQHDAFLLQVLASAKNEVRIVTPWIRADRIREPRLWDALMEAVARGVAVYIYTDEELNAAAEQPQAAAHKRRALHGLLDALAQAGLHAATVHRVHSKIVMADLSVYCVGSFNWFSAARDDAHARHETLLVYRGTALHDEIDAVLESLARRVIRDYPPAGAGGR
jgi:hypothetical protein